MPVVPDIQEAEVRRLLESVSFETNLGNKVRHYLKNKPLKCKYENQKCQTIDNAKMDLTANEMLLHRQLVTSREFKVNGKRKEKRMGN